MLPDLFLILLALADCAALLFLDSANSDTEAKLITSCVKPELLPKTAKAVFLPVLLLP